MMACDCKSANCTWRVSCSISIPSINSGGRNDFVLYNRILPYYSLTKKPTMTLNTSYNYPLTSQRNAHYTKSFRSKSHPQDKDYVRSKLNSTYQRGTEILIQFAREYSPLICDSKQCLKIYQNYYNPMQYPLKYLYMCESPAKEKYSSSIC